MQFLYLPKRFRNYPEFIQLAKNILLFYIEIHVADNILEEN